MLAQANRMRRGLDYRTAVRRGVRFSGAATVLYFRSPGGGQSVRFGFIVSKAVGNAVERNRVRRRLKAIAYAVLRQVMVEGENGGLDIVIRALPASAHVSWDTLHEEVERAIGRYLRRSEPRNSARFSVTSEGNVRP